MIFKKCKDCGRTDLQLSKKGICWPCGRKRMEKATWQMKTKEGTYYDRYLKAMQRRFGNVEVT